MIPGDVSFSTATAAPEKVLELMGVTLRFKATAADTNGQWAMVEYTAPPRFRGPQPHWHGHFTEAFYVLEGTLSAQVDGRRIEARPGDFILVPPRTVHSFSNQTDEPMKYLILFSPAGMEEYFEKLFELVQNEPQWPPADMSKVTALAEQHDTFAPPVTP
jgi:quercetin dioxygenase-like cupin family protein